MYFNSVIIMNLRVFGFLLQSVATFFSQVMAAIGGNTAGPGVLMLGLKICLYNEKC